MIPTKPLRRASLLGLHEDRHVEKPRDRKRRRRKENLRNVALAVLALAALDGTLSGTSLITPIDRRFLIAGFISGALTGLAISIWLVRSARTVMNRPRRIFLILFSPLFFGFGGVEVSWRIADWYEFGLSRAPFERAIYPVKYASPSTRFYQRDVIEIDPFDLRNVARIPVPAGQFDRIWLSASDYCVVVEQRRSNSGAIEIKTDGSLTLAQPRPVELVQCAAGDANRARRVQEMHERRFHP